MRRDVLVKAVMDLGMTLSGAKIQVTLRVDKRLRAGVETRCQPVSSTDLGLGKIHLGLLPRLSHGHKLAEGSG
jgi:hypothetical protein